MTSSASSPHSDLPSGASSPSELVGLSSWPMMAGLMVADALDGWVQCGVDLVDISRIRDVAVRYGGRFLDRVWTERELLICRGRYPELAARFAGKEAAMKALGTGVVGVGWREIEILPDARGKPLVFLHGKAKERAAFLRLDTWAISLSHSKELACAMVVACSSTSDGRALGRKEGDGAPSPYGSRTTPPPGI